MHNDFIVAGNQKEIWIILFNLLNLNLVAINSLTDLKTVCQKK